MNWISRSPIHNRTPGPALWRGGVEGPGDVVARLGGDGSVPRRRRGHAIGRPEARTDGASLESGHHLFDVVEGLGGCCITLDGQWRVTAITDPAAEWIGVARERATGRDARRDLPLPPGLVEAVEAAFATGAATRAILPCEARPGGWGEYQVFPFAEAANIVFWELSEPQLAALSQGTGEEKGLAGNSLANISGRALVIDRDWRIAGISPLATAWASGMSAALIGRDIRQVWPVPEGVPQVLQQAIADHASATVEFQSRLRPGRWVELRFHPFSEGAYLLFSDVTERRQAEESARSTAELLQGLTEAVSGEMAVLDERGRVLSANEAWRAAFPTADGGVGEPYADALLRVAGAVDEAAIRAEIDDLLTGADSFVHVSAVPTGQQIRWREFRVTPLAVAGARRFLAVHQDLTGYARVQDELNRTAEQLLEAQDDERERIAAELHDSTSQHLIAVNMGVMRLKRLFGDRKSAREVLQDMTASVQEALREIRVLSYLLRPADLERDGLRLAAERFVLGFGSRTGLKTSFQAVGALDEVSDEVRHACFRVVQEALANVFRHAQAQSARVEIVCRKGHLVARIADDGKGIAAIDGSDGPVTLGVGIPGMQARAAQLGGALKIVGGRRGTLVTAILPLKGAEAPVHPVR